MTLILFVHTFRELFHVLLNQFHPAAGVATVGVDGEVCGMVDLQLVDYILQGNHAVFEHPIPGVFFSMSTVVQAHVLRTFYIDLGINRSFFYLFQDRLFIDN